MFAYCLVINVHLNCLSISCISNSFILSHVAFFVNNFFQLFFNSFSLFQRRPLKLAVFQLFVVAVFSNFDNIHLTHDKSQHNFTIFFQTSVLTKINKFYFCFCALCTHLFKNAPELDSGASVTSIYYSSIQNSTPFS